MTDKMEKEAMQKFFNYMKAYNYPPRPYSSSPSPYYPYPPPPEKQERDKKATQGNQYPSSQMYGYPFTYSMPYPQGYPPVQEGESKSDADYRAEMMRMYSTFYNYYYPYSASMYPPYYNYPREVTEGKLAESKPQTQLKILPKEKNPIKKEIVISSDQEQAVPTQKPATQPIFAPSLPPKKIQVEKEAKHVVEVIIEEDDPFYIRKKHKIFKEVDKVEKQRVGLRQTKAMLEKEKERERVKQRQREKEKEKEREKVRYQTMPQQTYKEMLKKQRTMGMEMFLARQREKEQQQLKNKQRKEPEKQFKDMLDERQQRDKEKEKEKQKQKQKEQFSKKQDKKEEKKSALLIPGAPVGEEKEAAKRQRIRDDHPLKQLRYNQSHGRIRLGIYFQSSIPNLLRNQQIEMRRVELQQKLRQRQVSAITF